jgi:hypothetical protein
MIRSQQPSLSLFPCAVAADELESKQTKPPEDRSVIVTLMSLIHMIILIMYLRDHKCCLISKSEFKFEVIQILYNVDH